MADADYLSAASDPLHRETSSQDKRSADELKAPFLQVATSLAAEGNRDGGARSRGASLWHLSRQFGQAEHVRFALFSDVDLLGNCQGIIYFNSEVAD